MNTPSTPTEDLLELLDSWLPLSVNFRNQLRAAMQLKQVSPRQQLCHPDQHITSAWYNIDCTIYVHQALPHGLEEIIAIYLPGQILTDPHSFLQNKPSRQRITVLEGNQLLAISKQHFKNLRCLPETPLLLEHYLLQQQQQNDWRLNLLALNDQEKVATFAQHYPINHLPGHICASYLRMTQAHFSTLKAQYNRHR